MLILFIILVLSFYAIPSLAKLPLVIPGMGLTALVLSSVLAINTLHFQSLGSGITVLSGSFNVTAINLLLGTFMFLLVALILLAFPKLNKELPYKYNVSEAILSKYNDYMIIALLSTTGSFLLMSANSLIMIYLAIELQSFGVYLLAAMSKESESSTSAGLKYFLLGSLASCIILLGIAILYSTTGLISLDDIYSLYNVSYNNQTLYLNIGIALIATGMLFKIAAAPLHFWAPDVYQDTPTIITTWLTIMPKIAILLFLLELQSGFGLFSWGYNIAFENLLIICSALSLIIGSIMGLSQTKIKRLLAYSTISHVGFMLLILAVNSEESTSSLLFYIIQYSLTNLVVFLGLLHISYNNLSNNAISFNTASGIDLTYITELRSVVKNNFWLSFSLVVAIFSMAGIPPLPGFFAKQGVLFSAAQVDQYLMALLCIVVSVISATYYLKLIVTLYTESENKEDTSIWAKLGNTINPRISIYTPTVLHSYTIATLTTLLLLFVFNSSLILNATQLVSLSIF